VRSKYDVDQDDGHVIKKPLLIKSNWVKDPAVKQGFSVYSHIELTWPKYGYCSKKWNTSIKENYRATDCWNRRQSNWSKSSSESWNRWWMGHAMYGNLLSKRVAYTEEFCDTIKLIPEWRKVAWNLMCIMGFRFESYRIWVSQRFPPTGGAICQRIFCCDRRRIEKPGLLKLSSEEFSDLNSGDRKKRPKALKSKSLSEALFSEGFSFKFHHSSYWQYSPFNSSFLIMRNQFSK